MGISDDIRPKTYRPISKKVIKTEIKVAQEKIEDRGVDRLFQETHNGDFFADTPIQDKTNTVKKEKFKEQHLTKKHHWIYPTIIILAVSALIGLAVWQNYATLKSYIDGSYKKKNDQNLSDIVSTANDSNKNYSSSQSTRESGTATATQQPAAAVATVDKSTIAISVLNGSGLKNSALTVANTLKAAGFNVKSTANAKSFNYAKTFIYYKTDDPANANLVKDALSSRQTEVIKNTSIVGASYDIVVVVGKT